MPIISAKLGVTGLSDVGYQFFDSSYALIGSRVTAGVTETPGTTGDYAANATMAGVGVYWNSSGTASAKAVEVFDFRLPNIATGAAGAVSTLSAAQVNTECDTALADYDAPTNAEMTARTLPTASYALEATLTAIKGGSWSNETLKAIHDAVGTRLATAGYTAPSNASIATILTEVQKVPRTGTTHTHTNTANAATASVAIT